MSNKVRHRIHIVTFSEANGFTYLGCGSKAEAKIEEGDEVFRMEEKGKPYNNEASIIHNAKNRRKSLNRINRK